MSPHLSDRLIHSSAPSLLLMIQKTMYYPAPKLLPLFICIIAIFIAPIASAQYVQDRDLISLHYDHAPDRDDGHATVAALAVVRAMGIQPHVVSGAYGDRNADQYQPPAEIVMAEAWGSDWLDAHNNYQSSVNLTATTWLATLNNGGEIWVAEGGQSDFTSDVVRQIQTRNPGINTRTRIHVIQHSVFNEVNSNQADLNYSRANTDYIKIADGNNVNATADLNQSSAAFVQAARASAFGDAWDAAFNYLNPNIKLDFSDTVELLHILEIGRDRIATVDDFGAEFITRNVVAQPGSPTPYSDSYSVDGQCHCDTNFDHGLNSLSVDTPAGRRTIPQVCDAITATHGTGRVNNRVYYNTVQCGHPPANNQPDEAVCPGIPISNGNFTGSRCQQTGATWNLASVFPAPAPVVQEPPVAETPEPVAEVPEEPVAEEPVVTEEPIVANDPVVADVTEQPTAPDFPVCSSSDSDFDGDGFGFENNQSCVVAANTADQPAVTQTVTSSSEPESVFGGFPACSPSVADFDGDGFGFENNQSCTISPNTQNQPTTPTQSTVAQSEPQSVFSGFPTCSPSIADFDGDGFGFENNQSCTISANTQSQPTEATQSTATPSEPQSVFSGFPACSPSVADFDGDGFGFENNQSCTISANTQSQPAEATQSAATPSEPQSVFNGFPACSPSVTDFDGDGFGFENNQSCTISANTQSQPTAATQSGVTPSEPQSVFNGFPACSPSVTDFDGDGFGFENNQSCSISTGTQDQAAVTPNTATSSESPSVFSSFPACSPSVTDFDGDGFGFENNQSCVIGTSTQTTSQSEPQSGISGFPVCSASIIDFDGDGFAFENNQSCVIP